jgi:Zn finger protein HypA/HybF involved in hydrogenase expression
MKIQNLRKDLVNMKFEEWMSKYRAKPRNALWCRRCKALWDSKLTNGRCPKCDMILCLQDIDQTIKT